MQLQLNDQERRLFQSLSTSGEGEVLVRYLNRLVSSLTNTRGLQGDDIPLQVAAANKASDIIEENLIAPLSRTAPQKATEDRFD